MRAFLGVSVHERVLGGVGIGTPGLTGSWVAKVASFCVYRGSSGEIRFTTVTHAACPFSIDATAPTFMVPIDHHTFAGIRVLYAYK